MFVIRHPAGINSSQIQKVAAVGRALGFAGYGAAEDEGDYLADAPRDNQRQQNASQDGETSTTTIIEIENGTTKAGKPTLILHTVDYRRIWLMTRQLFRDAGWNVIDNAKPYLGGLKGDRFKLRPPLPVKIVQRGDFLNLTAIDPGWVSDDEHQEYNGEEEPRFDPSPDDLHDPYGEDIPF